MKYGYARTSTDDQTTALQLAALKKVRCSHIFEDKGLTGATTKRPALARCLRTLRPGDTLIVWKLDRLGRSLGDLITMPFERGPHDPVRGPPPRCSRSRSACASVAPSFAHAMAVCTTCTLSLLPVVTAALDVVFGVVRSWISLLPQSHSLGASALLGWLPSPLSPSHFGGDRKSTRLNSSHLGISYAVFC